MDSKNLNVAGEGALIARRASAASFSIGLLLALLGIFCVIAPIFTGIAITTFIGILGIRRINNVFPPVTKCMFLRDAARIDGIR